MSRFIFRKYTDPSRIRKHGVNVRKLFAIDIAFVLAIAPGLILDKQMSGSGTHANMASYNTFLYLDICGLLLVNGVRGIYSQKGQTAMSNSVALKSVIDNCLWSFAMYSERYIDNSSMPYLIKPIAIEAMCELLMRHLDEVQYVFLTNKDEVKPYSYCQNNCKIIAHSLLSAVVKVGQSLAVIYMQKYASAALGLTININNNTAISYIINTCINHTLFYMVTKPVMQSFELTQEIESNLSEFSSRMPG